MKHRCSFVFLSALVIYFLMETNFKMSCIMPQCPVIEELAHV